ADDAGHTLRFLDVDFLDVGVGVWAADERRVLHAWHHHVVDIAAGAVDESLVFLARDACADAFNSHKNSPPVCSRSRPYRASRWPPRGAPCGATARRPCLASLG